MWVADVPTFNGRPLDFRQLWIGGRKAVRARDVADFEQMYRIRGIDKAKRVIWVPAEAVEKMKERLGAAEDRQAERMENSRKGGGADGSEVDGRTAESDQLKG